MNQVSANIGFGDEQRQATDHNQSHVEASPSVTEFRRRYECHDYLEGERVDVRKPLFILTVFVCFFQIYKEKNIG